MKKKKAYLQQVPRLLQFLQNSLGVHQLSLFQSSTVNKILVVSFLAVAMPTFPALAARSIFTTISPATGIVIQISLIVQTVTIPLATSSTPAAVPTELPWCAPTVIVPVVKPFILLQTLVVVVTITKPRSKIQIKIQPSICAKEFSASISSLLENTLHLVLDNIDSRQ